METIIFLTNEINHLMSTKTMIGFIVLAIFGASFILCFFINEALNKNIPIIMVFILMLSLIILLAIAVFFESKIDNTKNMIKEIAIEENCDVILQGQHVIPLGINFENYEIEIIDNSIVLTEE